MAKILSVLFTIGLAYIMAYYTVNPAKQQESIGFNSSGVFYKIKCLITGETDTTDAPALYERAEDSFSYEDYQYAIKDYERAFKLDSSLTSTKLKIASCYLALDDTSKAISVLKGYLPTAKYKDEVANGLAKIYMEKGDLSLAEKYYKKALGYNPDNMDANADISKIYLQKQDYEKALKHISVALGLYSDNTDYLNMRRRIYLKMGKKELARLDLKHLVEIDAFYFPDYANEAKTAKDNGEYQNAIEKYKLALELDPGNPDYLDGRGWSYYYAEQYDSAYADFDTLVREHPEDYYYYFNRAYVLDALGRIEESINDYTKSISYKDDYYLAYNNRGYEYYQLKKYDLAEKDYTKSIELKSDYYLSYFNRGLVYYDQDEYEKAVADYKIALQYAPDNRNLIYDMGLAYDELKDTANAITYFNQYLRLEGDKDTSVYNYLVKRIAALNAD